MTKPPATRPDRIEFSDDDRFDNPWWLSLVGVLAGMFALVASGWFLHRALVKSHEPQPMELLALRVEILGLEVKALKAETKILLQDAARLQQAAAGLPVEGPNEPKR
jgi:hypothetical protein